MFIHPKITVNCTCDHKFKTRRYWYTKKESYNTVSKDIELHTLCQTVCPKCRFIVEWSKSIEFNV